jgi:hypothetical protein
VNLQLALSRSPAFQGSGEREADPGIPNHGHHARAFAVAMRFQRRAVAVEAADCSPLKRTLRSR